MLDQMLQFLLDTKHKGLSDNNHQQLCSNYESLFGLWFVSTDKK
tara:strand:+ start:59795 stop:59926 length:132 start_codon:yes stop_codon:yes gene_type:complete